MNEYVKHATKHFPGSSTTVTILTAPAGMYRCTVIHRFDSGNFHKEYDETNLSLVSAEGLMAYFTS